MKTLDIFFKAPSQLNDTLCPDGEIVGGERFFSSDSEPDSKSPQTSLQTELIATDTLSAPPYGATPLTMHKAKSSVNIITALADGALAFSTLNEKREYVRFSDVGLTLAHPILKALTTDDFLILITSSGIYYSLFDGYTYTSPSSMPAGTQIEGKLIPTSLEGYYSVSDTAATLALSYPCDETIAKGIAARLTGSAIPIECDASEVNRHITEIESMIPDLMAEYAKVARREGLTLGASMIAAALDFGDNTLTPFSEIEDIAHQGKFSVTVKNCSYIAGNLSISLTIDRVPCSLKVSIADISLPDFLKETGVMMRLMWGDEWDTISEKIMLSPLKTIYAADGTRARGWQTVLTERLTEAAEVSSLHKAAEIIPVFRTASGSSIPKELTFRATPDSPLFTLDWQQWQSLNISPAVATPEGGAAINSLLLTFSDSSLAVSYPKRPYLFKTSSQIEGEGITEVAPSFKSLSSGQLGEFPLYALCRDGIRALSPDNSGGFRSAQLISRDVALPGSVTTADSSIIFLCERGLGVLDGTAIKIKDPMLIPEGRSLHTAFHYGTQTILVYSEQEGVSGVYPLDGSSTPAIDFECRHALSLWPELFVVNSANELRKITHRHIELSSERQADLFRIGQVSEATGNALTEEIHTRPLKLGDRFSRKRIYGYRLASDAPLMSSRLEGSDDLQHWHTLISASGSNVAETRGHRGRGWIYHRLCFTPLSSYLPSGVRFYRLEH